MLETNKLFILLPMAAELASHADGSLFVVRRTNTPGLTVLGGVRQPHAMVHEDIPPRPGPTPYERAQRVTSGNYPFFGVDLPRVNFAERSEDLEVPGVEFIRDEDPLAHVPSHKRREA